MKAQHLLLYPDPAIDRDVPNFGIVDVGAYCALEAQKLISTLHTVIRDVNNRKGGAAIVASIAEVVDRLLSVQSWGLGQSFGYFQQRHKVSPLRGRHYLVLVTL